MVSGAPYSKIGALDKLRLRLRRQRLLWRSFRSRHQLTKLGDPKDRIAPHAILCFSTVRNEITRLPWFLNHYRRLGIDHFLIVDNDSDDGTTKYLLDQPDVSVWNTTHSYRASRFGVDWLTWLQIRYGHGHWCLTADADELLIYARHESRTLHDLTAWLEARGQQAFGAHLLDLYPKGPLEAQDYAKGQDPTDLLCWFDPGPYRVQRQEPLGNLWVQGGVRERVFFADNPRRSPTLNKTPLVKWSRRYAYVNSSHSALPRRLNFCYNGPKGGAASGVMLHTKFLPEIVQKSGIEKSRKQHFHTPSDFDHYYDAIAKGLDLWSPNSVQLTGWKQLEELGLMSSGGWDDA